MMAMLCLCAFSSCNQELIQSDGHGYLGISLGSDLSEEVMTKAGEELVFNVDVLNASSVSVANREITATTDGRPTAADPIELPVGSYTVEAASGENLNAAFENPYYAGRSAGFKINPNRTTTANLTCTLANTIFSVEFPGDFSQFTDYEVTVTNGTGNRLVFSNKPQPGNPYEAGFTSKAYFAVTGTLTWDLYLRNTDGGEYRVTETYTDVKAKQHYKLTFTVGEDDTADGAFIIKVQLDNSWDDEEHDLILDFSKKNLPEVSVNEEFSVVSGESFSVPVGNTSEKELSFSAEEGIKSLRVSHTNASLANAGLPEIVELAGAQSDALNALNEIGFVVTDIPTRAIDGNSKSVRINITDFVAKLPVGAYNIDFTFVDGKGRYERFELVLEVISDVDAEAVAARTGWAAFAQLEGRFYNIAKKDVLSFQYKKASDTEWIELPNSAMTINMVSLRYSTVVMGLQPSTEYVFRAVSDEDKDTKQISFTTAGSATIHNFGFDEWTSSDKYPNASGFEIWDSANSSGAATTTKPTTDAVRGKAAVLESVTAMGMMAAGNIFTGKFLGLAGLGARLSWGTPFEERPLALRGYYKYSPVKIDKAKDPYTHLKGEMDQCQILIFLTDWAAGPFEINTKTGTFVDFENDPEIIALAQFNTSESSSGYIKFTLPLVYRNNRIPKYIVIAGASSRYGDYFTGGIGSKLYIDEFELIYDPAELTDEEFKTVFSKVSPF